MRIIVALTKLMVNGTTSTELQRSRRKTTPSLPKIWDALVSTLSLHEGNTKLYQALHHMVYTKLINACSRAGNVDLAIRVSAYLDHSQDGKPPVGIFQHPLKTYVAAGDIQGAEAVFKENRRLLSGGLLD